MTIVGKHGRPEHWLRHVGELLPPTGLDALVQVSVGLDGPVALWAAADDRADLMAHRVVPGFASFPESRSSSQPRGALARYSGESLTPEAVTLMAGIPVAHPLVQPLPGGEFLVVGARCSWTEQGPERNALVIGENGETKRAGTLGDGVEHLLVDENGEVWTGYTDEGIFGNYGWGGPDRRPLGAAGIVRWSSHFEKLWEFRAVGKYSPAHCYTLNVAPGRTWACPYTRFPVVQIEGDGMLLHPTTGVSGPYGLIVAGDTIGFIGDYTSRGTLLLGSLAGDLGELTKSELRMPDGARPPAGVFVCRSSVVHFFIGAHWFIFDLADF